MAEANFHFDGPEIVPIDSTYRLFHLLMSMLNKSLHPKQPVVALIFRPFEMR